MTAADAQAAGESLRTCTQSFPARLAAAHPGPEISVTAAQEGVRYMLSGFTPDTEVAVIIKGVNYDLHFFGHRGPLRPLRGGVRGDRAPR